MTAAIIEKAYQLANDRQPIAAVELLESGSPDCLVELATWYLGGTLVPRDLARARECFGKAADQGHEQAMQVYSALVGSGIGGSRDWPGALKTLDKLAVTNAAAAREQAIIDAMDLDAAGNPRDLPAGRILSDQPYVVFFDRLFTPEECQLLIDRAVPLLQPSVVVDPTTGSHRPHPVRTSENAFFPWVLETPAIHACNRRLAEVSGTSPECGEPLQVLRYRPGQEYRAHSDALPGSDNQRIVTMLVYLNADYEGGETCFLHNQLKVRGQPGDAVLFRNADDAGRPDPASVHAGLPVTSGEKLIASRWIHQRRFGPV